MSGVPPYRKGMILLSFGGEEEGGTLLRKAEGVLYSARARREIRASRRT
jgi:hypothetical protein